MPMPRPARSHSGRFNDADGRSGDKPRPEPAGERGEAQSLFGAARSFPVPPRFRRSSNSGCPVARNQPQGQRPCCRKCRVRARRREAVLQYRDPEAGCRRSDLWGRAPAVGARMPGTANTRRRRAVVRAGRRQAWMPPLLIRPDRSESPRPDCRARRAQIVGRGRRRSAPSASGRRTTGRVRRPPA